MKILFLEKRLRTDKLGPMYLAAILREAGHEVDLIQDDLEPAEDYIERNHPDAILHSIMSADAGWHKQRNAELKTKFDFISIAGGMDVTLFPWDSASDYDRIVVGPGETAIFQAIAGAHISRGSIPDVNALPDPARDIQYKYPEFGKARMKRFIAGRYCPYGCTYCFNHAFRKLYQDQKTEMRRRVDPEKMIREIYQVYREYGLELVYMNDDDLAGDRDWLEEFCDRIKPLNFQFCGSVRANNVDELLLRKMKRSGCVMLNIALESANPATQKFIKRGMITNKMVEGAVRTCEKIGIKVRLQNMIGLPVADPLADALETLQFNQLVQPSDSWASVFQPYCGTELHEYCRDQGLIEGDLEGGNFYDGTPLKIPDAEKIGRLYYWWFYAVKHKLPTALVEILLDVPLPEEVKRKLLEYRYQTAKGVLYGL